MTILAAVAPLDKNHWTAESVDTPVRTPPYRFAADRVRSAKPYLSRLKAYLGYPPIHGNRQGSEMQEWTVRWTHVIEPGASVVVGHEVPERQCLEDGFSRPRMQIFRDIPCPFERRLGIGSWPDQRKQQPTIL